jgi:hypothetical protein
MFDDHIDAFHEGVVPAFLAYLEASMQNGANFKLKGPAIQAAHLLYHYRERVEPLFNEGTFKPKIVGNTIKDYELLGNVFNLTKHRPDRSGGKLISDSSKIKEMMVVNMFPSEQGPYMYAQQRIMVFPNIGRERDLLDICINVINGWTNFLIANKIIETGTFYRYSGDDFITRDQAEVFTNPKLTFKPGWKFNLKILGRGYNFSTGKFDLIPIRTPAR